MNNLTQLLAVCALAVSATSALAQDDTKDHEKHHPNSAASVPAQKETKDSMGGCMGMMDMPMMKDHMKKMRDHMQEMHSAKPGPDRNKMMSDHMDMMMDHMDMMMKMMGGGMPGEHDHPK